MQQDFVPDERQGAPLYRLMSKLVKVFSSEDKPPLYRGDTYCTLGSFWEYKWSGILVTDRSRTLQWQETRNRNWES